MFFPTEFIFFVFFYFFFLLFPHGGRPPATAKYFTISLLLSDVILLLYISCLHHTPQHTHTHTQNTYLPTYKILPYCAWSSPLYERERERELAGSLRQPTGNTQTPSASNGVLSIHLSIHLSKLTSISLSVHTLLLDRIAISVHCLLIYVKYIYFLCLYLPMYIRMDQPIYLPLRQYHNLSIDFNTWL